MSTHPTDAEIIAVAATEGVRVRTGAAAIKFARAVLAKWGQPAQAAEPVAWIDPWTGTKVTTDYDAYGKHGIPLYTAPQPAPAPLSESIDQVERALAIIGVVGAIDGHDVVRRESVLEIARRAALAAQGGKA